MECGPWFDVGPDKEEGKKWWEGRGRGSGLVGVVTFSIGFRRGCVCVGGGFSLRFLLIILYFFSWARSSTK